MIGSRRCVPDWPARLSNFATRLANGAIQFLPYYNIYVSLSTFHFTLHSHTSHQQTILANSLHIPFITTRNVVPRSRRSQPISCLPRPPNCVWFCHQSPVWHRFVVYWTLVVLHRACISCRQTEWEITKTRLLRLLSLANPHVYTTRMSWPHFIMIIWLNNRGSKHPRDYVGKDYPMSRHQRENAPRSWFFVFRSKLLLLGKFLSCLF